jgi:hypothetical protein
MVWKCPPLNLFNWNNFWKWNEDMKDTDILISENKYLEQINMKLTMDHNKMKLFIQELLHPEAFGHAVTPEVRKYASDILKELMC